MKPKFFELRELLPKDTYNNLHVGLGDKLWLMFDGRLLRTIDKIREKHGRMEVNNWFRSGNCQYRGWRPFDCSTGAFLSQHKFGRAIDLFPMDTTVDDVRDDIINNQNDDAYKLISAIELDVNWIHIDFRNWDRDTNGIFLIHP